MYLNFIHGVGVLDYINKGLKTALQSRDCIGELFRDIVYWINQGLAVLEY